MKVIEENRNHVIEHAKNAGVTLNDNQINALTYVAHHYGPYDDPDPTYYDIPMFMQMYKQYGDTDELRKNCFVFNDYSTQYTTGRCNALWEAFHNGVYKTAYRRRTRCKQIF